MKKILLFASALAGLFFAASCQQENLDPVGGNTVTYTVQVPDALATKALGDEVSNVNIVHYEVYRTAEAKTVDFTGTDNLLYHKTAPMTAGTATIDLELVNDQNYTVLFWAQVGEENEAYDVDDLTNVTVKTDLFANKVDYAAFAGRDFIVEGKNLADRTVTLKRPISQINIATTPESLKGNGAFIDDVVLEGSSVTVAGLSNTFDVANLAASAQMNSTYEFDEQAVPTETLEVNGKNYTYVAMNYVGFADALGTQVTVSYVINTTEGNIDNEIKNVPVKPNYRTNIVGNLITSMSDYTINLDKTWRIPEEDVLVKDITHNDSLQVALHQNIENIVIELNSVKTKATEPVEYTVNPTENQGGKFVWGGEKTKTITINGNGNKLNFNYTNADSQSIKSANPNAKIIINDAILTNGGKNTGPWNRHDLYFSTSVELNDVISDKALALRGDSKLTNVTISDVHPSGNSETYGIWIVPVGQTVQLDRVTITPSELKTTDRAIKIDKQYLSNAEIAQVTLNVNNSTFVSQKKAAVLVNSPAGAIINWGEGNDIERVAEDPINAVWVDDSAVDSYELVVVNGTTKVLEGAMKSVLVKTAEELQTAVNNAVEGVNEIGLGADITGDVTVPQNDKIDIIINGLNKKYDGTITVDGNSRSGGAETLVIKNINFEHSGSALYFIDQNSTAEALRYPHNVTVENCTFKGDGTNVICGVRYRQGFNNVVKNCTAEGLYLFMWTSGGNKIIIDNVDVIDSYKEGGFSLGQCNEFTVKNSKIVASDPSGYGIRLSASMPSTATIENCDINSFIPVMVREASENQTLTFNGSNTMTASNTDNIWCAIGTSAYTTNGTMPTPATGRVTVVLNDTGLNEAGVYGNFKPVARIGETVYGSFYEAVKVAKNGDTITLLEDAELYFTDEPMYNNIYASVIELNNKTLTIKDGDLRFATTTIKNGNIVVEPKNYPGTAVFLMYGENSLTIENTKITATGISGTYLIGLEGKSNLNLINSEILIDNPSLVNLIAAIACNGSGMTTVKNSNIFVKNINGRAFLNTSCSVENSTVTAEYVKAGFYIPNGKKLSIDGTSTVTITNLLDGYTDGIYLAADAIYDSAAGATINSTVTGRN